MRHNEIDCCGKLGEHITLDWGGGNRPPSALSPAWAMVLRPHVYKMVSNVANADLMNLALINIIHGGQSLENKSGNLSLHSKFPSFPNLPET